MSSRAVRDLLQELRGIAVSSEIVRLRAVRLRNPKAVVLAGSPGDPALHSQEVLNDSPAVWMFSVEKFGMKLDTE